MSDGGLTLLALKAENVRRVKLVEIRPTEPTGLVKVAGKNNAGKTSALATFEMLLGGKAHHPAKPIRTGEKKATASLVLQDAAGMPAYRISGTWTEKTYELLVERIGQGKIARPQEFLDSLVGAGLGFDPAAFQRQKRKDQVETLLGLLTLPLDPRTLDAERTGAYEERTAIGREVKQLEGQLQALLEPEGDVPDVELSIAALTEEYQHRVSEQGTNDRQRQALQIASDAHHEANAEIVRLEDALVAARADLLARANAVVAARARVDVLTDPDVAAAATAMRNAEAINVAVRAKRQRATVVRELETRTETVAQLTAAIKDVDQRKTALLAAAPFPIPGLGFQESDGDYAVTYHGIPLEDLTGSEPILVCTAIAMAANPTVRVILIRDASLLDAETLAILGRFAQNRQYHILTELVGDGDASSFVISEGEVVSWPPGVKTPTGPKGQTLPW